MGGAGGMGVGTAASQGQPCGLSSQSDRGQSRRRLGKGVKVHEPRGTYTPVHSHTRAHRATCKPVLTHTDTRFTHAHPCSHTHTHTLTPTHSHTHTLTPSPHTLTFILTHSPLLTHAHTCPCSHSHSHRCSSLPSPATSHHYDFSI